MKRLALSLASLMIATAAPAMAAPITITFDAAVADYTPTPGVTQEVTNQFASLGIVFADVASPGHGATLGRCGPGDGPVALFGYGADYPGCGDTTPDLNIWFVDTTDASVAGYTLAFSVYNYDGLVQLSAFDIDGNLLGTTSTSSGLLSLSGIGQISRVNLRSLDGDPTTLDTITYEAVISLGGRETEVPEPASIGLLGAGLAGLAMARRRRA